MLDLISELEHRLGDATARGLAFAVTRAIRDGVLQPGDRLPPIRELGHQLTMSPTTVSAAWGMLTRAGTIETKGRRGTVVTDVKGPGGRYRAPAGKERPFAYDLSTGGPDPGLLPDISDAIRRAANAPRRTAYGEQSLLPELDEVLTESWPYSPPGLAVADGALDALELVLRSRVRFGDRVVIENPTLRALVDMLEALGADIVGVPVDEEGLVPAALQVACAKPVQVVILQPRAHNPTGVSMSAKRARQLVSILRSGAALLVEDDSADGISARPLVTLSSHLPDRSVYIRSYSKSLSPDLRLAAVSAPIDVLAGIAQVRQFGQGWSSWILQQVLVELLTDERASHQVELAREEYVRRQHAFGDILSSHGVSLLGHDGLNAWVPVVDGSAALMRLAAEGIGAAPGELFSVLPDQPPHVRITVGLISRDLEQIATSVARATQISTWGTGSR